MCWASVTRGLAPGDIDYQLTKMTLFGHMRKRLKSVIECKFAIHHRGDAVLLDEPIHVFESQTLCVVVLCQASECVGRDGLQNTESLRQWNAPSLTWTIRRVSSFVPYSGDISSCRAPVRLGSGLHTRTHVDRTLLAANPASRGRLDGLSPAMRRLFSCLRY